MIVEGLARFWAKVDRRGPDDCWLWTGSRTEGGYGQMSSGATRRNRTLKCLATHVALAVDARPRPSPDHVAMHSCDTPLCVNPAHLRWGSHAENAADKMAKGRWRSSPPAGERHSNAKLTAAQVRYIRGSPRSSLELAAELGVTNQCISRVRLRQTWAHVSAAEDQMLESQTS